MERDPYLDTPEWQEKCAKTQAFLNRVFLLDGPPKEAPLDQPVEQITDWMPFDSMGNYMGQE